MDPLTIEADPVPAFEPITEQQSLDQQVSDFSPIDQHDSFYARLHEEAQAKRQQDWQDQDAHFGKLFTDPDYFKIAAGSEEMRTLKKHSLYGDDLAQRSANMAFLEHATGHKINAANYEPIRDAYTESLTGNISTNDQQFSNIVKNQYEGKKAREDAFGMLLGDVALSTFKNMSTGEPMPNPAQLVQDLKTRHPEVVKGLFKDSDEATLIQNLSLASADLEKRFEPYAPMAKQLYESVTNQTGQQNMPDAAPMRSVLASLQNMTPDDRQKIYAATLYAAKRAGFEPKGFLMQLGESLGRGTIGMANQAVRVGYEQALRASKDSIENPDSQFPHSLRASMPPMTDEQKAAKLADIDNQLGTIRVMREVNSLAQEADPIKKVAKGWLGTIEGGAYGVAGTAGILATSAVPVIGPALTYSAIYGGEYEQSALENPNVDPKYISNIAGTSAFLQTLAMGVKLDAITGKLPMFSQALERMSVRGMFGKAGAFLGHSAVISGEGFAINEAQAFVPIVLNQIGGALNEDFKAHDFQEDFKALRDAAPESLVTMVMLSVLGAGAATYHDVKNGEALLTSEKALRIGGASEKDAAYVAAGTTPDEVQKRWQEIYPNRTPENIADGVEISRVEADKVKAQQESASRPTLEEIKQADGSSLWRATQADGNLLLETPDHEAALAAIAHENAGLLGQATNGIGEAVDYINKVNEAQGNGPDALKVLQNDAPVSFQKLYEANPTPENLDRLFETVRHMGDDISEPSQLANYFANVSNRGEIVDGIFKGVIEINGGADAVQVMRDFSQLNLKRAMETEGVTLDWVRSQLSAMREGPNAVKGHERMRTETDTDVIESFSDVAVNNFLGKTKDAQIPQGLRGFIRQIAATIKEMVYRAYHFKRAVAEGKIGADFHDLLAKSLGLDADQQVSFKADQAHRALTKDVMVDAPAGEHYSISRAEKQIEEWAGKGELVLQGLPDWVLKVLGKERSPLKIKENIVEKNAKNHPELSADDTREILQSTLLHPDEVFQGKPKDKPNYWVFVHKDEKNRLAVVEISDNKANHEVVGWRYTNEKDVEKIKENARREGGRFLIPEPEGSASSGLHDVPPSNENIPPQNGGVNFSISRASDPQAVQKALYENLNKNPRARLAMYEKAKRLFNEVRDRRGTSEDPNKKFSSLLQSMGELEAILKVLPADVRGKVGGYIPLANLGKDTISGNREATIDKFLSKRVDMVGKALETSLKKEYDTALYHLFERSRPAKDEAGKRKQGKAGANIHSLFDQLRTAKDWTPEEANAHIEKLQAECDTGELKPFDEAHKMQEMALIALVHDWKHADAERRGLAIQNLENTFERGYQQFQMKKFQERDRRNEIAANLIKDSGIAGTDVQRDARVKKDQGFIGKKTAFIRDIGRGLVSFDQALRWHFGDKSEHALKISDAERHAANKKSDLNNDVFGKVEHLLTKIAGSEVKGGKMQWDMTQKSIKAGTRELSQLEGIAATLMWRQEDGKRHMEGKLDDNGRPVGDWHYDQKFVEEIENQLTPEAKAIRDFLTKEYAGEWEQLNPVHRDLYGVDLPRHENYSPLTVKPLQESAGQMVDPVTGNTFSGASSTPGSLRTRGSAIAEPDFRDALQTFIAHKMQMNHWVSYAPFISEARAILGKRDIRNSLLAGGGEHGARTIGDWINVLQQGGVRDAGAHLALSQSIDKFGSRAAQMALTGKISVLLIQSTNLASASAEMPIGSYISRLSGLLTGNLGWKAAMDSQYMQRRMKEQPVLVRQAMQGLRAERPNELRFAVKKIGDLISGADALFTSGTYAIVYDYRLTKALKEGMPQGEAEAFAHNEAERITDTLSQPTRPGARSLYENLASGPGQRITWAFGSDTRKTLGMLIYAHANRSPAEMARTWGTVLIGYALMGSIIRSAWQNAKDPDSDFFDSKYWNPSRLSLMTGTDFMNGIPYIGKAMQEATTAAAGQYSSGGGDLFSNFSRGFSSARHLPDILGGQEDMHASLRDFQNILTTMGYASSDIAAIASAGNLAKDLYGAGTNVKKTLEK